jgi:SAM-dependent methyltransferase
MWAIYTGRMRLLTRLPPILRALLALAVAIPVAAGLLRLAQFLLPSLAGPVATAPAWALALWVGAVAALLGGPLGLERWWRLFLVLLPPAFVLLLALGLGAGWYLALFLLLVGLYWTTFSTRVPLYLAGPKVRAALLALLPQPGAPLRFVDLGCGLGGVVLALARARPDGEFIGVELAPLPAWIGQLRRALRGPANAHLERASLWDQPLADVDIVYVFLSPVPMPALWEKARREMRAGSLLVSNTFVVPGVPPDHVLEVDDARGSRLLVWQMGPQRAAGDAPP